MEWGTACRWRRRWLGDHNVDPVTEAVGLHVAEGAHVKAPQLVRQSVPAHQEVQDVRFEDVALGAQQLLSPHPEGAPQPQVLTKLNPSPEQKKSNQDP